MIGAGSGGEIQAALARSVIGGLLVDSGAFDWEASGLFPTLTEPYEGFHGLDFAEGYRNLPFVGVLKEHLYKEVLMRGAILEQLAAGEISSEDALSLLQGE